MFIAISRDRPSAFGIILIGTSEDILNRKWKAFAASFRTLGSSPAWTSETAAPTGQHPASKTDTKSSKRGRILWRTPVAQERWRRVGIHLNNPHSTVLHPSLNFRGK